MSNSTDGTLIAFLERAAVFMLRLLGFFAIAAVLILPGFKQMWIGYLPVGAGLITLYIICRPPAALEPLLNRFRDGIGVLSERRFFCLIVVLPALIEVLLICIFRSQPVSDAQFVLREARALVESGQMSLNTRYAPGSIWWYAGAMKLFGFSPLVPQFSLIPLAIGKNALIYLIGKVYLTSWNARKAAIWCAFFPSLLCFVMAAFYYFYLYSFLLALVVYCWIKTIKSSHPLDAVLTGVFSAMAALTFPVMLISPSLTLGAWVFGWRRIFSKKLWTLWLINVVAFGTVLTPWIIRNYRVFDDFVPVCTAGGYVFYSANNAESNGLYHPEAEKVAAQVTSHKEYLRLSHEYSDRAKQFIKDEPGKFLRLVALKNMYTWGTDTTFLEAINFKGTYRPKLDTIMSAIFQYAYILLMGGWVLRSIAAICRREKPSFLQLMIAILATAIWLVFSVFEGGARHHLALLPFLMLYVADSSRSET